MAATLLGLAQALGLMKTFVALLVLGSLLMGTGCPQKASDDQAEAKTEEAHTAVALDWLRSNKNESAFATNRFGPTSAAVSFVEQLFAAGATQVFVVSRFYEPDRIAGEGGPYADELLVQLPDDPEKRAKLFKIIAKETEEEGFDAPRDTGQSIESLWWD